MAVQPCAVNGSNPRSVSSNSSLLKIKAGRRNCPTCKQPRPIAESSEPFLADFKLAKALVLGPDIMTSCRTWACSSRTRMCDAPESTSIVALLVRLCPM